MAEVIYDLLDIVNSMCRIAFITYAWITMIRINEYIKGQENGNDK